MVGLNDHCLWAQVKFRASEGQDDFANRNQLSIRTILLLPERKEKEMQLHRPIQMKGSHMIFLALHLCRNPDLPSNRTSIPNPRASGSPRLFGIRDQIALANKPYNCECPNGQPSQQECKHDYCQGSYMETTPGFFRPGLCGRYQSGGNP